MSTATAAPRWIKLDELASQDLRADMAAFTERVETYGASEGDQGLSELLDNRWHDKIRGALGEWNNDDRIFTLAMAWTGYDDFYAARLAAGLDPASVPLAS